MNLTTLRSRVAGKVGLSLNNATELALLDGWINDGVIEVVRSLKPYVISGHMDMTASEGDYQLPRAILFINEIYTTVDDVDWSFERVAPQEILDRRRNSLEISPARFYAVNGANMLMVYPTPTGADQLTIYYVPRPASLTNGSDDPADGGYGGIPEEYHKLIEFYALWQAADFDDDTSSKVGENYRLNYEQELNKARKQMRARGRRRLPRVRIGGDRGFVPSSNGVDVR